MLRIKVRDQHEGHACINRQMREQLLERFEAAGGCSDADCHERSVSGLLIPGAVGVRLVRVGLGARLSGNFLLRRLRPFTGLVYRPIWFCSRRVFWGRAQILYIFTHSFFHDSPLCRVKQHFRREPGMLLAAFLNHFRFI